MTTIAKLTHLKAAAIFVTLSLFSLTGNAQETRTFEGTVVYGKTVNITSEQEGRIEYIAPEGQYVSATVFDERGKTVHDGDIVLKKKTGLFEIALETASLKNERAKRLCANAQKEYARAKELVATRTVSESEYETALMRYETAIIDVKDTENELERCRGALAACYMRTPFNAIVEEVYTAPGSALVYGVPVAKLGVIDPVRVHVKLTPEQMSQLGHVEQVFVRPNGSGEPAPAWLDRADVPNGVVSFFVANHRQKITVNDEQGKELPVFDRSTVVLTPPPNEAGESGWVPKYVTDSWNDIKMESPASLWVAWSAVRKDDDGYFVWQQKETKKGTQKDAPACHRLEKVRITPAGQMIYYGNLILMGIADNSGLKPSDILFSEVPENMPNTFWGIHRHRHYLFQVGEKVDVVFCAP